MLDLYDELKAVLSALEKAEVPYALCGGLALAVYGHPRATIDIDLLVPSGFVEAAVVSLRPVSFGIDALPKTFAKGAW